MQGTVADIRDDAVHAVVLIDIGHVDALAASITPDSVRRLALETGSVVTALVKASHVVLTTESENRTSARSFPPDTVRSTDRGVVDGMVVPESPGGRGVTATVTNARVDVLGPKPGVATAGPWPRPRPSSSSCERPQCDMSLVMP